MASQRSGSTIATRLFETIPVSGAGHLYHVRWEEPQNATRWPSARAERATSRQIGRRTMRDAIGMAPILLCLYSGGILRRHLHIQVPDSVIGMMLLFLALETRLVPLRIVSHAAAMLLFLLPAMFIPLYVAPFSNRAFWLTYGMALIPMSAALTGLGLAAIGLVLQRTSR